MECFVAVWEERGFTRAAERLHVVQSAVSATVKTLEAEVGHPLFFRSPRTVTLTPEGSALLEPAREVLRSFEAFRDSVAALSGELRGSLAIGILAAPDILDLAHLVGTFTAEFPAVSLTVRAHPEGSAALLNDLVAERLDVSMVVLPIDVPPEIEVTEFASGPLRLAVAPGHPLTALGTVRPADVVPYPFVDFPQGFSTRAAVDAAFARVGVSRDSRIEGPSVDHVTAYIAAGAGIGFVPVLPGGPPHGVTIIEVTGLEPRWTGALATKRGRHHGAAFRELHKRILARAAEVSGTTSLG
ncbi:DNA-binding transcriptional regulator, LysR family [Herbiconiux ginsengi]|uniref:DNA-binding transcriptional regulator, LysR family n=2 Tax=Herbiconiux ginsengi TaxID=381665 RepID=A0A1H3TWR6_9MICO|nr:DNA-binding transcriptional regulator, LysR family [Herbiconiux ginsengi]